MGCCGSDDNREKSEPSIYQAEFKWNTKQLQAEDFQIGDSKIKLKDKKKKPHRVICQRPLGKCSIQVSYVQLKGKGSFALGVCHYGTKSERQKIQKIGMKNVVRLFVSQKEGEIQSQGQVMFHSKSWAMKEEDKIEMAIDASSKTIEWKKKSKNNVVIQKSQIPSTFIGKNLYLQLIVYEPETQLNILFKKDQ